MDYLHARKPVGGFLFVTVTQLSMVWWAYQQRFIQLKDLRVWFAALELVARRCGLSDHQRPHYGFEELRKLVAGRGGERASVARLEQVGLLLWDSAHITFAQTPSDLRISDLSSLFAMLSRIQNNRRKVPVPRQVVRFIASPSKRCVIATILGHLLRALYYRSHECVSGGFCKASWVADVFGIDIRNVKAARTFLARALGLLEMAPTPQSLLNRYGQRVLINLAWNGSAVDKSAEGPRELPPPEPRITTGLPPLRENKKPFREQEHQKPACGRNPSGCLEKQRGKDPTLTHIMPEDLRDTSRLLSLFKQAQAQGLIGGSESEQLTFVATAERAQLRAIDNPQGLFAELVRRRLWHFITQDDEDRAHKRLREHFYGGDPKGRPPPIQPPQETLSKDACFVADISARLRQRGFTGDVLAVVSQELPEWTRERWEKAAHELSVRRREEASGAMERIGNFALLEHFRR